MGAGVGALAAPAVFRIIVDFKDRAGTIVPFADCKLEKPERPSAKALSVFHQFLGQVTVSQGPMTFVIPGVIPRAEFPSSKAMPQRLTPSDRSPGRTPTPPGTMDPRLGRPSAAQGAVPLRKPEDRRPEDLNSLCTTRRLLGDKVVWLPTRSNPGDPDSPITGGMFLIRGDLSLAEAANLNCALDGTMASFNESRKRAARKQAEEQSEIIMRASANVGPAASETAADWGNKRDVSTSVSAFCQPELEPEHE